MVRSAFRLVINMARLNRNPIQYFRSLGVEIGEDVEILGAKLLTFGSQPYLVSIGNHVTISHDVDFITHDGGLKSGPNQIPGCLPLWADPNRRQLLHRCP